MLFTFFFSKLEYEENLSSEIMLEFMLRKLNKSDLFLKFRFESVVLGVELT